MHLPAQGNDSLFFTSTHSGFLNDLLCPVLFANRDNDLDFEQPGDIQPKKLHEENSM